MKKTGHCLPSSCNHTNNENWDNGKGKFVLIVTA